MDDSANGITVCVRVRPLNHRELDEGNRVCVHFDEPTKQVVLTAVDRSTLVQLKGSTARGYAFDKRFGQDDTSQQIYDETVSKLVESIFKGYNGTVLAYGQTGSGKTHTMAGGVGHYGVKEPGVTPQVISHMYKLVDQIRRRLKPGESIRISASAVEIYNETLRDLSKPVPKESQGNWDSKGGGGRGLHLQEIPTGQGNRVRAEVAGLAEFDCDVEDDLTHFFESCFLNRSTSCTLLNDSSSRSHAIFTINVHRVMISVGDSLDANMKAKVRTERIESKLHLVDLAGSERIKRSGVVGKAFTEATHINCGLLALGNVIVALADDQSHIPYRTSKLTRLIQDSLGGNSLTVLITCISPSEADFEETNNTLKYANRACSIKNQALPNKFLMLEEDLLPVAPGQEGGDGGVISLANLLENHMKQREFRAKRNEEKQEKERARESALRANKDQLMKTKGFQRLLASEYDRKLKEARLKGRKNFNNNERIDGGPIMSARPDGAPAPKGGAFDLKHFLAEQAGDDADASEVYTPDSSASPAAGAKVPSALAAALKRKQERAAAQAAEESSLIQETGSLDIESRNSATTAAEEEELPAEVVAQARADAERDAWLQAEKELVQAAASEASEEQESYDSQDEESEMGPRIKPLARFKVNKQDVVSVFKATSKEDFRDVVKLLPENTPLPASNKMTYLIARLEANPPDDLAANLEQVISHGVPMGDAVGPAVGCLMATFGTNMISSCIFDFDDPEELEEFAVEERIELWGLQIPHNSLRPALRDVDPDALAPTEEKVIQWSSVDRLNMSVGLLYALCVNAEEANVRCGFCVPRSQLLRRWQGAGVKMKEVDTSMRLIYPPHAHDFEYYKSSTVAYFLVDEVQDGLRTKLSLCV